MKLHVDFSALHRCADAMRPSTDDDKTEACESCPLCDDWGYLYEGGMSMNPEIDNRTPCPRCNPDGDD